MSPRFIVVGFLVAGCGGSHAGGLDAGAPGDAAVPDDAMDDAMVDAMVGATIPPPHVGGWRMANHDASNANHSDVAGPPPIATNKLLYEEPGASLGAPVIDELGNLYLTSSFPRQAEALLSLTPAGALRWRTTIAASAFLSELSLGPDGNVYAISASVVDPGATTQIVVFDAATGAALPGSTPIAGLTRLRLPPDRRVYTATFSDVAGPAIQMRSALDAAPVWSVAEGGSTEFALSPDGATLVLAGRRSGMPAPYDIIALDAATGAQRWHRALDATLDQAPQIAVDSDGAVYLASSSNDGDLHVIALSPDGAVRWDHTEPFQRLPRRLLVGRTTVTVAAQEGGGGPFFTGLTVQKADGVPTTTTNLCGDPQAIDRDDRIYWVCNEGILSADPAGTPIGQWRGRSTLALVLGPEGTAYEVPAAFGTNFQLFSIERDIAPTPPPGLVHVQVFSTFNGLPEPDVRVLFAAPNDALIADVRTDAQGRAVAAMAAGYVTVERHTANFDMLTTLLDVKQGDNLVFGPAADDRTALGTTTVTVPPLVSGDVGPSLYTPCQRGGIHAGANPVTVDANPACREHAGVLARASHASAFSYLADQDLTAGGAITMPAWQPTVTTKYTLSGFPDNINFSAALELFADVSGYQEPPLELFSGRSTTQTFDRADVGSALLLSGFTTRTDDNNQIGDQEFFLRTPAAPAIDLATPLMRWLFRPTIDPRGPSPRLTWIQEGADTATLGWLSLSYGNPRTSQHNGSFLWDVVGPVLGPGVPNTQTIGSYTLPQLPDPELRLSVFGAPSQAFVRALAANPEVSYDQLRPVIAREFDFNLVWARPGTEGLFLNFRDLFALPAVTDVRFSGSLVGTGVIR